MVIANIQRCVGFSDYTILTIKWYKHVNIINLHYKTMDLYIDYVAMC